MELVSLDDLSNIRIESEWSGLASPPHASSTLEIVRLHDSFFTAGPISEKIEASLVNALLSALSHAPIGEPDVTNMGFTPDWLKLNVDRLMEELFEQYSAEGRNRFRPKFSSYDFFSERVARSFHCQWTDDYPSVQLIISTKSGRRLCASSSSQQPFMIPWTIETSEGSISTHNAQLGRAIASLMPPSFLNRARLMGESVIARTFALFALFTDEELLDCPVVKVNGHAKAIELLAFSPDGEYFVSTSIDSEMKSWDSKTWVEHHRFETRQQGANLSIDFSPNQRTLAFNDARILKLVDLETAEVKQVLEGHNWIIKNLAVSPDGLWLASTDSDGMILWNLSRCTEITRFKNEQLVGFSFDSARLFASTSDGVIAYDLPSFNRTMMDAKRDQMCLADDGSGLAWIDENSLIHVWDLRQNREVALMKQSEVSHLTVSPDCSFFGCTADDGVTIVVTNLQVPTDQFTIPIRFSVSSLLFANDSRQLVVCYGNAFEIWDVNRRERISTIRTRDIKCLAVSPDSKTVLTGHRDGWYRVWSIAID